MRGVVPPGLDGVVAKVAARGATPLVVAENAKVAGVIALEDILKPDIRARMEQLKLMGLRTVMITGDNPLTAQAIAHEAGIDDFIAEATPEKKLAYLRAEQGQGKLVAMMGDGTNDAPSLAQADVGLAMNSGTQAAKEAGNMVDLDSDPTKLIEVVAIGKQLLMTRGALTTFSIANDVAKYFAIVPAMFAGTLPWLKAIDVMHLAFADLGDPVGGHIQRADHSAPDPDRAQGRSLPALGSGRVAAPQSSDLGPRRRDCAIHRNQGDRRRHGRPAFRRLS